MHIFAWALLSCLCYPLAASLETDKRQDEPLGSGYISAGMSGNQRVGKQILESKLTTGW